MDLRYEPPVDPEHSVDVTAVAITLDGVQVDFSPGQLVAVLGEPRAEGGIGGGTLYWDADGIAAFVQGGRVTGLDLYDEVVNTNAVVPRQAGRILVTIEGKPAVEADWATSSVSQGERTLIVGGNRITRGAFPGQYSYWSVAPDFSAG